MDDGTYAILTAQEINHINGDRISIIGKNTYSKSISSIQSTGTQTADGAYNNYRDIIVNVDTVTNAAVNDYALVSAATSGTNPLYLTGCHKITNIDAGNTRITIRVYGNGAAFPPSGAVHATCIIIKTILNFSNNTNGLYIKNGNYLGNLSNIIISGTGQNANKTGIWLGDTGNSYLGGVISIGANVGISYFNIGIRGIAHSILSSSSSSNTFITACLYGIYWDNGSSARFTTYPYITGNYYGIYAIGGSNLSAGINYFVGNTTAVYALLGSSITIPNGYVYGDNGSAAYIGIIANTAASINISSSVVANHTTGIYPYSMGTILATSTTFLNNTLGIQAVQGGTCIASFATFTSNTTGTLAGTGGYCYVGGFTDSGNNTTLFSPATNVIGKGDGLIDDGTAQWLTPGIIGTPRTSASAGINTVETVVVGGATAQGTAFPINSFTVPTTIKVTFAGTCTSAAANTSTFGVRCGISGTVTDPLIASFAVTAAGTGTTIPFTAMIEFTVTGVGASGSVIGVGQVTSNWGAGIYTYNVFNIALTVAALNTTTANLISGTYKSNNANTTCIFTYCTVEILKP